jgi:hypothetical protein
MGWLKQILDLFCPPLLLPECVVFSDHPLRMCVKPNNVEILLLPREEIRLYKNKTVKVERTWSTTTKKIVYIIRFLVFLSPSLHEYRHTHAPLIIRREKKRISIFSNIFVLILSILPSRQQTLCRKTLTKVKWKPNPDWHVHHTHTSYFITRKENNNKERNPICWHFHFRFNPTPVFFRFYLAIFF